jgi:DNA repair protein RecO (recombination protein O)
MSSSSSSHTRFQDIAYVLHTRPYQNTSVIVEVFSRSYGRLSLLAKGAKRPASPMYGVLQPLQPLFLSWGGRSELKTLYSAELDSRFITGLAGDYIYLGMYLNELLVRLLHKEEAHADIFDYYRHALVSFEQGEDDEIALRYFELQLLDDLGYAVDLETDSESGLPISSEHKYRYVPERGFVRTDHDEHEETRVHGSTIHALASKTLSGDEQKREAKLLMRGIIEYHLDGQPLKTRELFQQRKRFQTIGKNDEK